MNKTQIRKLRDELTKMLESGMCTHPGEFWRGDNWFGTNCSFCGWNNARGDFAKNPQPIPD